MAWEAIRVHDALPIQTTREAEVVEAICEYGVRTRRVDNAAPVASVDTSRGARPGVVDPATPHREVAQGRTPLVAFGRVTRARILANAVNAFAIAETVVGGTATVFGAGVQGAAGLRGSKREPSRNDPTRWSGSHPAATIPAPPTRYGNGRSR